MGVRSNLGSIINLLLLFLVVVATTNAADFSVLQNGANPAGAVDSTKAFVDTWTAACAAAGPGRSNFVVPKGNFLVGNVTFEGPCKSPVDFLIQGTVKADPNPAKFTTPDWIVFQHLTDTKISGGGIFDGQGQQAWKANDCAKDPKCPALPINIRFNYLTNAYVTQITSANSKNFNVNVMSCTNITIESFTVTNPADAPNTDGIHLGESSQVSILNSTIGTGDDCVSIGPGNAGVKVVGVTCGPGHGFSIGSLGKYPNEHDVSDITVSNCTLSNTLNGVRVKSWAKAPNSAANAVSKAMNFVFEDIIMNAVQNPIVIDQLYCPYVKCSQDNPSQVAISNVTFNNIRGTTITNTPISIVCSKGVPCKDIQIGNINLKYTGTNGTGLAVLNFATPVLTGTIVPPINGGVAGAAGAPGAAPGPAGAAGAASPAGAAGAASPAGAAGAASPAGAAGAAAPAGAAGAAAPGGASAASPVGAAGGAGAAAPGGAGGAAGAASPAGAAGGAGAASPIGAAGGAGAAAPAGAAGGAGAAAPGGAGAAGGAAPAGAAGGAGAGAAGGAP